MGKPIHMIIEDSFKETLRDLEASLEKLANDFNTMLFDNLVQLEFRVLEVDSSSIKTLPGVVEARVYHKEYVRYDFDFDIRLKLSIEILPNHDSGGGSLLRIEYKVGSWLLDENVRARVLDIILSILVFIDYTLALTKKLM